MIYAEHILICIAVPLLIALAFIRGNARRFAVSLLAGMGVCLLAAYISSYINSLTGFGETQTAVYISPVVEELMKFLPLLLYLAMLSPEDGSLSFLLESFPALDMQLLKCSSTEAKL